MMRRTLSLLGVLGLAGSLALETPAALAVEGSGYRVRDLLQPCVEGDNDSRGGAVLELECEQYVLGFTDLYLSAKLDDSDKVCLPDTGNLADEIRWAFMRWAHENFDERDMPAVNGLRETVRASFKCGS